MAATLPDATTNNTYLTDVKGRVSQQAQSDIAGLQSAYQSTLAQQTNSAYQAQLNRLLSVSQQNEQNRLSVSEWNASERTRAEALAWQRAFVAASQEAAAANTDFAAATHASRHAVGAADAVSADSIGGVAYVEQTLEAAEQTQARTNISAARGLMGRFKHFITGEVAT